MKRIGEGLSLKKQAWIKYSALLLLAVAAFGAAGLALMNPRGPGEPAGSAAARPPTAASAAPAAITATPAPTATATAQRLGIKLPAQPVLLILGDSYTAGVGANRPNQGWAYLVAGALGFPTNIDGVSGTGFAWGGGPQNDRGRQYAVRLKETAANPAFVPSVLILQGGQNDALTKNPAEIQSATTATIESARKLWPGVQVVVLGPSAPQPAALELRDANSAVRAGAAAAKAPFIDAIESGWFTAANSPGFNADGAHVNTAGHARIAEKFLEAWKTLVQ